MAADEPKARVLVLVRGGVADVYADEGVEVCLIDYDNEGESPEPDTTIPADFASLLPERTVRPWQTNHPRQSTKRR